MNQEKFDLVREAISEAAKTDDERLIMSYRITPETKLPPMQPLFEMFDTPCFYRGELVAACGKAKSGKTLFLSILMAACLCHTDLTDLTELEKQQKQNKLPFNLCRGATEGDKNLTDVKTLTGFVDRHGAEPAEHTGHHGQQDPPTIKRI